MFSTWHIVGTQQMQLLLSGWLLLACCFHWTAEDPRPSALSGAHFQRAATRTRTRSHGNSPTPYLPAGEERGRGHLAFRWPSGELALWGGSATLAGLVPEASMPPVFVEQPEHEPHCLPVKCDFWKTCVFVSLFRANTALYLFSLGLSCGTQGGRVFDRL